MTELFTFASEQEARIATDALVQDVLDHPRVWRSNRDKYGLRLVDRISKRPDIGTVMMVLTQHYPGKYTARQAKIGFTDDFVELVGELLPLGVCEENPAMLVHLRVANRAGHYFVASYLDMSHPVVLWKEKKPWWNT